MSADNFHLETATPADIQPIIELLISTFSHYPLEQLLGNTFEHRETYSERHLSLWQRQTLHSLIPCAIKCVHTTTTPSSTSSIVGFCEWLIYPEPWTDDKIALTNFLLSASWLPPSDPRRTEAETIAAPILEKRTYWMARRPAAFLLYVCVPPEWRQRGIASQCVTWGLEQCAKYRVPAYLEASNDGAPVYRRLGFEQVDKVADCAVMIWWPPGTSDADKKPAASM